MRRCIPEATAIVLTREERATLEGLARSTRTEHRLRQRARIVLLAASGTATAAIGRAVGCTTGTASKWRGGCAPAPRCGVGGAGKAGAAPQGTGGPRNRRLAGLGSAAPQAGRCL